MEHCWRVLRLKVSPLQPAVTQDFQPFSVTAAFHWLRVACPDEDPQVLVSITGRGLSRPASASFSFSSTTPAPAADEFAAAGREHLDHVPARATGTCFCWVMVRPPRYQLPRGSS